MHVRYVNLSLTPHLKGMAKDLGIIDGLPFSIGDDFKYDPIINDFFYSLPTSRSRSPHTWRAYAEQLSIFFRFLDATRVSWKNVTTEDIRQYYVARRLSPSPNKKDDQPISTSTWNGAISALIRFYEWAVDQGHVEKIPFTRRQVQDYRGGYAQGPVYQVTEKERAYQEPIKIIRLPDFQNHFLPALEQERNGQRDVSLAKFLITTGCRIQEALNVKLESLPNVEAARYAGLRSVEIGIKGKGQKDRQVMVRKSIIREIRTYAREDRADVLHRWEQKNPNVRPNAKAYPGKVWLSERGTPLQAVSVQKVFQKASKRCGIHVHPHLLRHTFATYELKNQIRLLKKALVEDGEESESLNRLLKDPVRAVQRKLGHASMETTLQYLDYIHEDEERDDDESIWAQAFGE